MDFLYFSLITLTTTGYGDLAAHPLGRAGGRRRPSPDRCTW